MSFTMSTVLAAAVFAFAASASTFTDPTNPYRVSESLQTVLQNNLPGYSYATDLTRNIVPKPLHSHNDYWRDEPVYSALSVGAISIEADVWLYNGTLYIGHEQGALNKYRTFDGLYVQPLVDILQRQNPSSPFVTAPSRNGVFDMSSGQTLYLWIDLKTNGPTTWPYVLKALQPLRDGNWLTTFNGTAMTPGPITVIGTGNTPLNLVQGVSPRDYFVDAPLALLNSTFSNITASVSPIASVDFASVFGNVRDQTLNATQMAILTSQIAVATSKGIGARYWNQPGFPASTRNAMWRILYNAGVALVNVDDLQAAAGFADAANYW